jgi:hypothetical protein
MGVQTTEARGGDGKQRCVMVREVFEENDKFVRMETPTAYRHERIHPFCVRSVKVLLDTLPPSFVV